jgi:hypothetical protein
MKRTESTSSAQVRKKTQPEEVDLVILGGGSTIAPWTFAGEGKQVAVVHTSVLIRGVSAQRCRDERSPDLRRMR